MPHYETPEPISVTLELGIANVRIAASGRTDTVVEVRPTNEDSETDVKAAAQVRTDYANGTLHVTGPRPPRFIGPTRKSGSVDVTIELPSDSRASAQVAAGEVRTAGRLGAAGIKTGFGNIWVEQAGALNLRSGFGHITADTIAGDAEMSTGGGKIQIGEIAGTANIKNSTGDIIIDTVAGDARLRSASGAISVDRAAAGLDAKTSAGRIHVGQVARGSVVLATAGGGIEVGIAEGTAAWLEANTGHGHVRNLLEDAAAPEASDETVEVRARTAFGDITIRRA